MRKSFSTWRRSGTASLSGRRSQITAGTQWMTTEGPQVVNDEYCTDWPAAVWWDDGLCRQTSDVSGPAEMQLADRIPGKARSWVHSAQVPRH